MIETSTLGEIEQKTKVNSNIYKVPVDLISFSPGSEGGPLQVSSTRKWLIEAESPQAAVLDLTEFPAYWKNWNSYPKGIRELLAKNHYNPFRINLEEEIELIPACENRHRTEGGHYVCGIPSTEGEPDVQGINGEFGDCMCQSYWTHYKEDLLPNCPYRKILKD